MIGCDQERALCHGIADGTPRTTQGGVTCGPNRQQRAFAALEPPYIPQEGWEIVAVEKVERHGDGLFQALGCMPGPERNDQRFARVHHNGDRCRLL